MNYINNLATMCCCGFNDRDKIEVSETYAMIDCETGIEVKYPSSFSTGHTYRCERRWALMEGYTALATFATKDEALAAYSKTVDGLRERNTVVDILPSKNIRMGGGSVTAEQLKALLQQELEQLDALRALGKKIAEICEEAPKSQ